MYSNKTVLIKKTCKFIEVPIRMVVDKMQKILNRKKEVRKTTKSICMSDDIASVSP
jgi:HSP90 family molecular chaperone